MLKRIVWASGLLALGCGVGDPVEVPWVGMDDSSVASSSGTGANEDHGNTSSFTDGRSSVGTGDDADDPRPDAPGDGGTDDGNATGGDGADDGPHPPQCPANCYCEPIDPGADISDLEAGYSSAGWAQTMFEVLGRRWPSGRDLLVSEQNDPWFGAFADTSSFAGLMDSLMTEVHEATHGWDYGHATVHDFAYFLRADLTFHPPKVSGFPRSEIHGMLENDATSLYASTYLTGTQGTYGFYELLDEMNSYINGMGAIAVVGEHIPWGISGRDGAVALMYYLELYLRRARTAYPGLYEQLQNEPQYVELIETQWLRLNFLLEVADQHQHIGIHDAAIRQLMYAPDNRAEIEMFIGSNLDTSNCLP
jgi:hypothetical protein